MNTIKFTEEELEEMRRADEEIEREFRITNEEISTSNEFDRSAKMETKDNKERRAAAKQREYREANREEYNEYMREYMRQYRIGRRKKEEAKRRVFV